nr:MULTISPECIES: type III-B CRISPR module RAMP protein Cmr1 [Thermus]
MRRVKEWSEAYAPRLREEGEVRYRYDGVPLVKVERTYRLLTPLFGGGVEPRLADPVTVVRGTEVRGQLRFWWRAVRGWQAEGDLKRLFDLEAAIFGSAGEGGLPLWPWRWRCWRREGRPSRTRTSLAKSFLDPYLTSPTLTWPFPCNAPARTPETTPCSKGSASSSASCIPKRFRWERSA